MHESTGRGRIAATLSALALLCAGLAVAPATTLAYGGDGLRAAANAYRADAHVQPVGGTELLDEDDWISTAVCLRETGELVGDTMLHWVSREHRVGEIGFMFHPDHHGRGYATESALPLMDFGFEVCGFHRIIGRLEARNGASARVLEKLGMRREALLIENELVKGEWQSEIDYAILEREWRAQRDLRDA